MRTRSQSAQAHRCATAHTINCPACLPPASSTANKAKIEKRGNTRTRQSPIGQSQDTSLSTVLGGHFLQVQLAFKLAQNFIMDFSSFMHLQYLGPASRNRGKDRVKVLKLDQWCISRSFS